VDALRTGSSKLPLSPSVSRFTTPLYNFTLQPPTIQSLFKLHPLYDDVVVDVVLGDPNGHVVFTEGRRQRWTDKFKARLKRAFDARAAEGAGVGAGAGGSGGAFERVHFVPRQPPGDGFMQLLAISDVVLHPYPFGGSRTSSEAMALGLPTVTLPTNQVRVGPRHRATAISATTRSDSLHPL